MGRLVVCHQNKLLLYTFGVSLEVAVESEWIFFWYPPEEKQGGCQFDHLCAKRPITTWTQIYQNQNNFFKNTQHIN